MMSILGKSTLVRLKHQKIYYSRPKETKNKKVCTRNPSCFTNTKYIDDSLNKHDFTITNDAMLKNRTTDILMPLYM